MKFSTAAFFLTILWNQSSSCCAFSSPGRLSSPRKISSTQLYIIGPMIRRMREEQAKKKMPMASEQEREGEAPGLRVGSGAWRWPPVWPYSDTDFVPKEDITEPKAAPVTGLLAGNLPKPDEIEEEEEEEKKETLDVLHYWGEEKAGVKTEIDPDAVKKLKE